MTNKFLKLLLALILILVSQSQAGYARPETSPEEEVKVERVEDLGFGFRRVVLRIPTPWELGHFSYLYYQDQRLCRVGKCAVSPSGDYVIYQDAPSANLFLYRRADGWLRLLTIRPVPIVVRFDWHEDTGKVEAHFLTGSYSIQDPNEELIPPIEELIP